MSRSISIVLVNWNQTAAGRVCLQQLLGWRQVEATLWFVDNHSSDADLSQLQEEFPQVRFIFNKRNLGWGGGNNVALRRVESEYVLLLNSDALLDEDATQELLSTLYGDSKLAAVGPVLVGHCDGSTMESIGGRDVTRHVRTHLRPSDLGADLLTGTEPLSVEYLPGAAVLWRTSVLQELGYFEEAYFFGGEMAECCERAREEGHGVAVLPTVRAGHDLNMATDRRRSLYPYYILRNRFLFVRRRRSRILLPLFIMWAGYGLLATIRSLLRADFESARLLALAVVDGLRGTYGNQNLRIDPE